MGNHNAAVAGTVLESDIVICTRSRSRSLQALHITPTQHTVHRRRAYPKPAQAPSAPIKTTSVTTTATNAELVLVQFTQRPIRSYSRAAAGVRGPAPADRGVPGSSHPLPSIALGKRDPAAFLRERGVARKGRAEESLSARRARVIAEPAVRSQVANYGYVLQQTQCDKNAQTSGREGARLGIRLELRPEGERSGAHAAPDYRLMHEEGALQAVPCVGKSMALS
jgi:hypothetical protein